MQKTKLVLLLTLAGLLSSWGAYAQSICNLPAPTNIQFSSQGSLNFVVVTWSPVSGAAAYWATFHNLSNNTQPIQTSNPATPTSTFTVIPGDYYLFRVAAQCLQPDGSRITSNNFAEKNYLAESIIIDIIVKIKGCSVFNEIPNSTTPVNGTYTNADLDDSNLYAIKLLGGGGEIDPMYRFYYNASESRFMLKDEQIDANTHTAGLTLIPMPPPSPPFSVFQDFPPNVIGASTVRVIQTVQSIDRIAYISFPTAQSIHLAGGNNGFTGFKMYVCSGGGASPSQAGEGDDPATTPTTEPVAQAALHNIQVVNPFTSALTLLFREHPEQPLTAQLYDVSGRVQVQQTIQPVQVNENQHVLLTADLPPGMYFLRLETAPGVFSTHKVVKYQ